MKITEFLNPGNYVFEIVAEVSSLKLVAKTKILLIVESTEMEFEYVLRMVEVEEESPHINIMSLGNTSCTYVIQSQTPSQGNSNICISKKRIYF